VGPIQIEAALNNLWKITQLPKRKTKTQNRNGDAINTDNATTLTKSIDLEAKRLSNNQAKAKCTQDKLVRRVSLDMILLV